MYRIAKGTNTPSVMASCRILSWGSESSVKPMRFAGTINMYSKNAMPQLTSAAIHHGLVARFFRCAYQAKVMKMLEATRSSPHVAAGESCIQPILSIFWAAHDASSAFAEPRGGIKTRAETWRTALKPKAVSCFGGGGLRRPGHPAHCCRRAIHPDQGCAARSE